MMLEPVSTPEPTEKFEPDATPYWEMQGCTVRMVESELARLWTAATTRESNGDGTLVTEKGVPHARTSVLNLIVTVRDEAASKRILETLLSLGSRHPSRAIVLQADENAQGAPLDARIQTHCRDGEGHGRICFEQLALTVRGEAARHLDGIVAPLVIHDLPTDVWWPSDPPFHDPVFNQLVEMADRLVVNSTHFSDLSAGLKHLGAIRRRAGVGDIAWERLAPWMELTAQFFDAPRFRRYLPNLSRLRIKYAVPEGDDDHHHKSPEAAALLYAGWIATRLAWRRARPKEPPAPGGMGMILEGRYEMVDIGIEPVPTRDNPPGELLSVRLRAFGEAGSAEFIVDRPATEATVVTNADGMTALLRRIPLSAESEAEVLRRQLVLDQRDLLYEDALRAAGILLAAGREAAA